MYNFYLVCNFFPGLTQDCLHCSPWFEWIHFILEVCGMLILCYQDSYVMVGVYSTFCECLIHHFVIMRTLIWCCHGEGKWPMLVACVRRCIQHHPDPARTLSWSAQLTVNSGGYYQQSTYWPLKYTPETGFRRYLVLNSLSSLTVSQLQDRDNEGRGFIHRSV